MFKEDIIWQKRCIEIKVIYSNEIIDTIVLYSIGSISVNKQCSYNKQCLGFPNAVCIEGKCTCIQGYTTEANGHCIKRMRCFFLMCQDNLAFK